MSTTTSRHEFVKPATTDGVDVLRTSISTNADKADHAAIYDEGPLGSRPPASSGSPSEEVGDLYLVNDGLNTPDVPILFQNRGTHFAPITLPTFSAKPSSDANTISASSAPTKVLFATEEWDDAGWFTPATSRFLPDVDGVFRIRARVGLKDNIDSGDVLYLAVYKNGVEYRALDYRVQGGATALASVGGATLVEANGTSDYFEIWALCSNGAARAYFGGASTYFQAELVRPA